VSFDPDTVEALLKNSSDGVALVQEGCYRICEQEGVSETQNTLKQIGKGIDAKALIGEIVNDQAGRYMAFITNFSEGFQQTDLEMNGWRTLFL
jgi:hypothetical protein